MPDDNTIPCRSVTTPMKRPIHLVETKSAEELAIDLVGKLDLHRISL
jgi:uncharacterized protein (DUF2384 family)